VALQHQGKEIEAEMIPIPVITPEVPEAAVLVRRVLIMDQMREQG
jgi:hypothetical protein|tara:strand:+ start:477 stop:611 length:135 start_codon:yes stop_codon:yes gene_type:complete